MEKKFRTIWRISVLTIAVVLFIQLFATFGEADNSVRIGRVIISPNYLANQVSSEKSSQLTERF